MANIGKNQGRRLRMALSRFSAMLIEEARDISGLTFEKLDEEFGFPIGRCKYYAQYPVRKKTRAAPADEIQNLENLVARLLKRPVHVLIIEDTSLISVDEPMADITVGVPDKNLNLRHAQQTDLVIAYEDDWPTYRRLKYDPISLISGYRLIDLYVWQWGIFWDSGVLPEPWTRKSQGFPEDAPIALVVNSMMEKAKAMRLEVKG